jgi:formylglycine-generating enzyme required for sulfatase activity
MFELSNFLFALFVGELFALLCIRLFPGKKKELLVKILIIGTVTTGAIIIVYKLQPPPLAPATSTPEEIISTFSFKENISPDDDLPLPTVIATMPKRYSLGFEEVSKDDGMPMIYVPEGDFLMGNNYGDSDEKPEHKVFISAFWFDKTEVTNAMYIKYTETTGYRTEAEKQGYSIIYFNNSWSMVNGASWLHPVGSESNLSGKDDHPVVHVTWNDSLAYCMWVGRRLPTEAEWEKAARGTDGRLYPWGNDMPSGNFLNFNGLIGDTKIVGSYSKGASPYGAVDLAGNVWEWVADWYDPDYYDLSTSQNPSGPTYGSFRVFRGGSFHYDGIHARSTYRGKIEPEHRDFNLGFRCAKSTQ